MTVFINGRFLSQKLSGVQRFAREIVRALDSELRQIGSSENWILVAPPGTACDLDLNFIKFEVVGKRQGHIWEQNDLYCHARNGTLINLGNSGPVLHKNSFTIIHDAMVFRTPDNFSMRYRVFHKLLGRALARRSSIGTVSEFSRRELIQVLGLKSAFVVPNSCEHLAEIKANSETLDRLALTPRDYVVFVGSPTPNKNLSTAIKAIGLMGPGAPTFVVVGSIDEAVFGGKFGVSHDRVLFTGRLPDAEVVALYQGATALIFPSLYEGFGITPLEAMLHGCPVLSSDIPPVREVCGESALYFNAKDPSSIASALKQFLGDGDLRIEMARRGKERATSFSWDRSARALLKAIAVV